MLKQPLHSAGGLSFNSFRASGIFISFLVLLEIPHVQLTGVPLIFPMVSPQNPDRTLQCLFLALGARCCSTLSVVAGMSFLEQLP